MSTASAHTIRRPFRHVTSAVMTVLYLLVLLSPLAPSAAHSLGAAGALARQCSGDCNSDGCSAASRINGTCCCSKKKQQLAHAHAHDDAEAEVSECCKKDRPEKKTVIACGCPCGNEKQTILSTSGSTSEVLPFHFSERFVIPHTDTIFPNLPQRLTSRVSEPPDPPPQNTSIC